MAMTSALSDVVWADILGYLRTHHPLISRGWFSQLQVGTLEQGQLSVLAGNDARLDYLASHCVRPFAEAAQAATGRLLSVRFMIDRQDPPTPLMGAIAEDEKMFGKGLILIALPETLVLFGFAIAFLLMQKIV